MTNMFTHTCIKPGCGEQYQDTDQEAYYCDACKAANKAIAEKVDAKLASRPKRSQTSALQEYDNAQKVHGFMHVKF